MKWLSLLLSVLVMHLSMQPLCDSSAPRNCSHDNSICSKTITDQGPQENGESCTNTCNPFESCSCCTFCIEPSTMVFDLVESGDYFFLASWPVSSGFKSMESPSYGCWNPPKEQIG